MTARITELRSELAAAVSGILQDDEKVNVSPSEAEYEGGLEKQRFSVAITVGDPDAESTAERLDELLSGPVRAAIESAESRPLVIRSSGYQNFPGPDGTRRLGATWTAVVHS
jgi:hypothetical protein